MNLQEVEHRSKSPHIWFNCRLSRSLGRDDRTQHIIYPRICNLGKWPSLQSSAWVVPKDSLDHDQAHTSPSIESRVWSEKYVSRYIPLRAITTYEKLTAQWQNLEKYTLVNTWRKSNYVMAFGITHDQQHPQIEPCEMFFQRILQEYCTLTTPAGPCGAPRNARAVHLSSVSCRIPLATQNLLMTQDTAHKQKDAEWRAGYSHVNVTRFFKKWGLSRTRKAWPFIVPSFDKLGWSIDPHWSTLRWGRIGRILNSSTTHVRNLV